MNENLGQYLKSNKRMLKCCRCQFKKKLTNNCNPINQLNKNDFFDDYKIQPPKANKTEYLYVDRSFISNVNCPENDETFYDCCASESDIVDETNLTDKFEEPKNLKILLKDVAMTTNILYKSFRKAYHTTKKDYIDRKDKKQNPDIYYNKQISNSSKYNNINQPKRKSGKKEEIANAEHFSINLKKNKNFEINQNNLRNRLEAGKSDHEHVDRDYIDHNPKDSNPPEKPEIKEDQSNLFEYEQEACGCEKKRHKKTKSIRMEPVSVTIPVTLFVESAKGKRTIHTQMIMEAFGDMNTNSNLKAIDSECVEPIRTATISAGLNVNNRDSQIDNKLPQNERGGQSQSRILQDADMQTDQYICNESVHVQTVPSDTEILNTPATIKNKNSDTSIINENIIKEDNYIEEEGEEDNNNNNNDNDMMEYCKCQSMPNDNTNLTNEASKTSLNDNSRKQSPISLQKRQQQKSIPIKYKTTALTELTIKTSVMSLGSEIFFSCGSSEEVIGKTKRSKQGKLKFTEKDNRETVLKVPKEDDELSGVDDMPMAVHVPPDYLDHTIKCLEGSIDTLNNTFKYITESRSDIMRRTSSTKEHLETATQHDSEELICGKNLQCASRTDNKDEHMPFPNHKKHIKDNADFPGVDENNYIDVRGSKTRIGQSSNAPEHFRVSKMRTTYKLFNSQACSTYYRKLSINDVVPIQTNLRRYTSLPISYTMAPFERRLIKSKHLTNISTNQSGKIKYIKLIPFEPQAPPIYYGELEPLDELPPESRPKPKKTQIITEEPEYLIKQTSFPSNFNLKTHILDYNPYIREKKALKLSDLQKVEEILPDDDNKTLDSVNLTYSLDSESDLDIEKLEGIDSFELNSNENSESLQLEIKNYIPNVNSISIQTDAPKLRDGHQKRTFIRYSILDKLYELIRLDKIDDNTINIYNVADREQILHDIHKITSNNISLIQSTRSGKNIMTIEKIKYLFSELSADVKLNYDIPLYEDTLDEYHLSDQKSVIDNLRHILNPKTKIKPKHIYSKSTQEQILDLLDDLLKPPSTKEKPLNIHERQAIVKSIRQKLISDGKILNSGQASIKENITGHNLMFFSGNELHQYEHNSTIMEEKNKANIHSNLWEIYTNLTEDRTTSTSSISIYKYINDEGNISEEIKQLENAKYVQTERFNRYNSDDDFIDYDESLYKRSRTDYSQLISSNRDNWKKRRYQTLLHLFSKPKKEIDSSKQDDYYARSSVLLQKIDYRDNLKKMTETPEQQIVPTAKKNEKKAIILNNDDQLENTSYLAHYHNTLFNSILNNYDPPGDFDNLRRRWRPSEDYRPYNRNYKQTTNNTKSKEHLLNLMKKQLKSKKSRLFSLKGKKRYLTNDSKLSYKSNQYIPTEHRESAQSKSEDLPTLEESSSSISSSDYDEKMIDEQTISSGMPPAKSAIQVQFEQDNDEYITRSSIYLNNFRKSKVGKNITLKNADKTKSQKEYISRSKITLVDKTNRSSAERQSTINTLDSNAKLNKVREPRRTLVPSQDEIAARKSVARRQTVRQSSSTNIENNPNHINNSTTHYSSLKINPTEMKDDNIDDDKSKKG